MLGPIGVLDGDVQDRGGHARPPTDGQPAPPAATLLARLARLRRAGRISTAAHAATFRYWSLLVSGAFVAVSAVGSVVMTARVGADDAVDLVALRLLAYAAWLYGLVGLPALLDPRRNSPTRVTLAALRGVDLTSIGVRAVGLAERLARGLLLAALPGFLAIAFVLPSGASIGRLSLLLSGVVIYLVTLAGTLGVVGALSERIAPRASRGMALSLLLLPLVLSVWLDGMPSVPGLFITWFRSLASLGVLA